MQTPAAGSDDLGATEVRAPSALVGTQRVASSIAGVSRWNRLGRALASPLGVLITLPVRVLAGSAAPRDPLQLGVVRLPALAASCVLAASCAVIAGCESEIAKPDAPESAWRLGPPLPRPVADAGVGAFGLRLAVVGGVEDAGGGRQTSARVDAYHTTDRTWGALPDLPVARAHPSVAMIGTLLMVVGGFDPAGQPSRDAFVLDPLSRTWRPVAALDAADARAGAGVVAAPGRMFLVGGVSARGALASVLEYDTAADVWSPIAALPEPRAFPAVMRMEDGTLIVAGGFADAARTQARAEVWELPPAFAVEDRVWRPAVAMPSDRGGCAYGVVLGELVCAGGDGSGGPRTDVASYDATVDEWTVREAMPVARGGAQGAAVGMQLYVPGGGGAPSDALWIYRPLDTAPR